MNHRQLKFRIWDIKSNKMIYDEDWIAIGLNGRLIEHNFWHDDDSEDVWNDWLDQKDYIIQQFTGLTDKNGKEIYEGDIVKQTMEKGPHLPSRFKDHILKDCEKQHVAEITWGYYTDGEYVDKIECFMFGDRNSLSELIHRTAGNYHEWIYTYEIIGNIFENPELLNPIIK